MIANLIIAALAFILGIAATLIVLANSFSDEHWFPSICGKCNGDPECKACFALRQW